MSERIGALDREARETDVSIDFAQAIRDMGDHVTKRVETAYERAERMRQRTFPARPAPETRWRVNWTTMKGADGGLEDLSNAGMSAT